ncbi:MAG: hypothetical protein FJX61_03615 [Alphaproteobacteria bacterium]|nr:hypothetical protein [Alphaproteobacteria bacterium]
MTDPAPFTYAHYRRLIAAARAAGYGFAPLSAVAEAQHGAAPVCFLRHDCDNDLVAAARLARIESEAGVTSTFFVMLRSAMYNVLAPTNAALVREILARGHQLGLHFDESLHADVAPAGIAELVDRERAWLHDEFGQPIEVVSFHQPSPRVLDGGLVLNCLNSYDRAAFAGVHYVSDSNLRFRDGDPIALFQGRRHRLIQLLLHPEWWSERALSLDAKWDAMLANNIDLMQQGLIGRELTFTKRRRFRIDTDESGGGAAL